MEALPFTMPMAHGGVGVAETGCGGKHYFLSFSPLFWFASVFLCFFLFTHLSLFFSFFSRLFSSLCFLLLLPFFVSYALASSVFSSLHSPSPYLFSSLFDSSSGFYSQRMQVFFGNVWRAS